MIRVLQVVGRMHFGGTEARLLEVAHRVDPSKIYFDFSVFGNDPGAYAEEIHNLGFGVVKCRLTRNIFGFSRRFRAILRRSRYNIVHSYVWQFSALPLRRVRCHLSLSVMRVLPFGSL